MAAEIMGATIGTMVSITATGLIGWAGYGWVSVARIEPPTPWVRGLALGLIGICLVLALRQFYWGVLWALLNDRLIWTWENMLFDAATAASALTLLRARWLLIPEPERDHWSWLTAPLFPPKNCILP